MNIIKLVAKAEKSTVVHRKQKKINKNKKAHKDEILKKKKKR